MSLVSHIGLYQGHANGDDDDAWLMTMVCDQTSVRDVGQADLSAGDYDDDVDAWSPVTVYERRASGRLVTGKLADI